MLTNYDNSSSNETTIYKFCPKCDKILSIDHFYKVSPKSDQYRKICKNCFKERSRKNGKKYRELNKEKEKERYTKWISLNREYKYQQSKLYENKNQTNKAKAWAGRTLYSHKKRGFEIDKIVTPQYLGQLLLKQMEEGCYYCGEKLEFNSTFGPKLNSPSLDIIDPLSKIITPHNIQITCFACNVGKNSGSHEEFIKRCVRIVEKHTALL